MAFENGLERFGDVGDGINVAEFARRDDGREQRPIFGLDLVSGEQCILARKSTGLMAFSTGFVSSSRRPSSKNRVRPAQWPRA